MNSAIGKSMVASGAVTSCVIPIRRVYPAGATDWDRRAPIPAHEPLDFVQRGQLSYSVPFEVDWQTQGAWPMIDGDTRALDLGDEPRGSATRDGSHPGCLRTTVLPRRLDQGPSPRRRGHPGHRPAHRLCRPADPGQGPGTPLHQLSPRPEPRRLVLPGRRTDPLGPDRRLDPRWLAH